MSSIKAIHSEIQKLLNMINNKQEQLNVAEGETKVERLANVVDPTVAYVYINVNLHCCNA